MDTPLTPEQAKRQLQYLAQNKDLPDNGISLKEAKSQLKTLDDQLELPPIAHFLDRGEFKKITAIMTAWAFSTPGRQALTPGLTTLAYYILRIR